MDWISIFFSAFIFSGILYLISYMMSRNVVMIKSSKDTRYAIDSVVTHDGAKFPCWALPDLSCFRKKFGEDAYNEV